MTRQERIVAFLEAHGGATFPQLHQHLECKRSTASFAVGDAFKSGLLRREGERRHYMYYLKPRIIRATSVFNLT